MELWESFSADVAADANISRGIKLQKPNLIERFFSMEVK
jgi:hypothetical protein